MTSIYESPGARPNLRLAVWKLPAWYFFHSRSCCGQGNGRSRLGIPVPQALHPGPLSDCRGVSIHREDFARRAWHLPRIPAREIAIQVGIGDRGWERGCADWRPLWRWPERRHWSRANTGGSARSTARMTDAGRAGIRPTSSTDATRAAAAHLGGIPAVGTVRSRSRTDY